jgi:hypothetical protein
MKRPEFFGYGWVTKRPVIGCGRRPGRSALEFSLFCRVKDSIDLGARSWVGDRVHGKGREHVQGTCMREEGARGARRPGLNDQIVIKGGAWKLGFVPLSEVGT